MKSNKTLAPPTGYYHPKFKEIDKEPHLIMDIYKSTIKNTSKI